MHQRRGAHAMTSPPRSAGSEALQCKQPQLCLLPEGLSWYLCEILLLQIGALVQRSFAKWCYRTFLSPITDAVVDAPKVDRDQCQILLAVSEDAQEARKPHDKANPALVTRHRMLPDCAVHGIVLGCNHAVFVQLAIQLSDAVGRPFRLFASAFSPDLNFHQTKVQFQSVHRVSFVFVSIESQFSSTFVEYVFVVAAHLFVVSIGIPRARTFG